MGYYEFSISVAVESREAVIGILPAIGCLGMIETDTSLIAYFPDVMGIGRIREEIEDARVTLRNAGLPEFRYDHLFISERDWNESWKKKFQPLDVGAALTIIPPWEHPKTGKVNLIIDPGMAFGTGHHETTKTCLMLIERLLKGPERRAVTDDAPPPSPKGGVAGSPAERFLDVGTGTGILAIAASKLGCRHVVAVDIDPLALDAARRNAALNIVENVEVREGSIDEAEGAYGVITANLLSEILIRLAPDIAARLAPGGAAILSGILDGQEDNVISAMEKVGLKTIEKIADGRWVSLVCVPSRINPADRRVPSPSSPAAPASASRRSHRST
jgi:ribosomal protein L11 methyltransferase